MGPACVLKVSPSDDHGLPIASFSGTGVISPPNEFYANSDYPAGGIAISAPNMTGEVITAVTLETAAGEVLDGAREHDQLRRSGLLHHAECNIYPADFCSPLHLSRPVLPGETLAFDAHYAAGIPSAVGPQILVTPQTGPFGDPLADIDATLDYHEPFLAAGTSIAFPYQIYNKGPLPDNATLQVNINGSHIWGDVTETQGSCLRSTTASGSMVSCDLGTIANAGMAEVTINVTAPTPLNGHLTAIAVTSGEQVDPDTSGNLKPSQALHVIERTDLDPNQSSSRDLNGDGIHDEITVGTKNATLAGTDDIDNDPMDKEVIVEDPNLDPNASQGYDLDGDGDLDVIVVGTKNATNQGGANIDNDPKDNEIILHDPNLDPNASVGYDLDGDGDMDIIVVGTKNTTDVGTAGNYAADDTENEIPIQDPSLGPDQKIGYDLDGDGDSDIILHGSNGPGQPRKSSCATEHVLVFHTENSEYSVTAVNSLKAGYDFTVGASGSVDLHTTPGGTVSLYPGMRVHGGGILSVDTTKGPCMQ